MSLFNSFALPDPDDSYLDDAHPAAKKTVITGGVTRTLRKIRLWGWTTNNGALIGDLWPLPNVVRTLPTANKTIQVNSDSTTDTTGGTGARTIRVWYLDFAGAEHTADYVMNGTTAVTNAAIKDGAAWAAPITDCWRVNYIESLTAGSNGANAGNITVNDSTQTYTAGVPSNNSLVYGYMAVNRNSSDHGFYTVPAGYKAQVKQKVFGCVDATATVKYGKFYVGKTNPLTGLIETKTVAGDSSNSGGTTFPMAFETIIDEKCDLRFQGIGLASATSEMIAIIDLVVYPKV